LTINRKKSLLFVKNHELDTYGMLYFLPPKPIEQDVAVLSSVPTLIILNDASYITLRGFVMEACRSTALMMKKGENNTIAGCTIRNTGHQGVIVDGGKNHRIVGCDIYDTGSTGLTINGGDLKNLIRADHYVENVSKR